MRRCILLIAAALAGCEGDDTIIPAERMIETGTYAYEGRWLHPHTAAWDTATGELAVEGVTPDSIHGRWTLAGFRADSVGGAWNENAYALTAVSPNGRVRLTSRLSRIGSPSELRCSVHYWELLSAVDTVTTSGTCDVSLMP